MMARSTNASFKARIQKRKTNHLPDHHIRLATRGRLKSLLRALPATETDRQAPRQMSLKRYLITDQPRPNSGHPPVNRFATKTGQDYPVADRIEILLLNSTTNMIVETGFSRVPIRFEPLKEPNTVPLPTASKPELMPGGNDAKFRSFIHNFLAFSARVDQCRTGFGKRLGISGIAYTTLISIAHLQDEEGVGVSRIAEHLHLSGAFVTIEVSKLVKAELVKKRVNKTDRRRVLLTVTPKGRKLLDGLAALQAPVNDALFECLSAE